MVYQQNVLHYRAESTGFEELHSVTVPATAKAADIAKSYAGNPHFRLVKLTTYGGVLLHNFERQRQKNKGRER
jgi:hypothetical protein